MPKHKIKQISEERIDSVRSFASRHPATSEGGVRWLIFQHRNKLLETGAIFRCGRRLFIDEHRFIAAMKSGELDDA